MVTKQCKRCKEIKSESLFNKDNRARDGRRTTCAVCVKAGLTNPYIKVKDRKPKLDEVTGSYVYPVDFDKKD